MTDLRGIVGTACGMAGVLWTETTPIRIAENGIYRLGGRQVARVSRPGQLEAARQEIEVARWLAGRGIAVVRPLEHVAQPVLVDDRAVTFWHELHDHRHGTPAEVAAVLRALHDLPVPQGLFGRHDPFSRLPERIAAATTLHADDRAWLREHLHRLRRRHRALPEGLAPAVVHGDAWVGNVVTTSDGTTVLLDLERCSVGAPEWDLVSTAIKHTSVPWTTAAQYEEFCQRYGHDVTGWAGFTVLRDIRELRMTLYLAQRAAEDPRAQYEARLRVDCLRGRHGARPWPWTAAS